tara:strand:+ start:31417 stop:31848 length:432 start_codon:yes stop_codon:yes gene_type:complete
MSDEIYNESPKPSYNEIPKPDFNAGFEGYFGFPNTPPTPNAPKKRNHQGWGVPRGEMVAFCPICTKDHSIRKDKPYREGGFGGTTQVCDGCTAPEKVEEMHKKIQRLINERDELLRLLGKKEVRISELESVSPKPFFSFGSNQ